MTGAWLGCRRQAVTRLLPHTKPTVPPDSLLSAALRYLARGDRTVAQMTGYLNRKNASPALVRRVLVRLRGWGYLDDGAFAARWAGARLARRPMGRARLEAELRAKGFDEGTVLKTVVQVFRETDEADLARTLVARRLREGRRGRVRAAAVLRRDGFTDDTIEAVLGAED